MTRYPKSGKGKKWTALELKAVPLAWRGDMLSDGDGLTGEVRVVGDQTISIHFKFAFKWNGKVAWHYCGTWPAMSMEQIRRQRDEARDLVRSGVNPNDHKKAERIENQAAVEATIAQAAAEASQNKPFKDMFDAWLADGVARKDGNALGSSTHGHIDSNLMVDAWPTIAASHAPRNPGCPWSSTATAGSAGARCKGADRRHSRLPPGVAPKAVASGPCP